MVTGCTKDFYRYILDMVENSFRRMFYMAELILMMYAVSDISKKSSKR